ncbi:Protein THYLAKOID FORMATION 1, chloroplastic [Tetrabaena socialis]|uniref:Protein THYLAKOID FORMATION 1, chloroplastic n=1 Tax=Tetrabaena socialis TaxID=47790 RepID=A0A2J8A283_9CHLO|nr:Protein THYLAKOID FORMATION 1, chloroplastic [Tetrabaena socialis]|eukprot:PNH06627.1 Protein THYLAKOID FORMATION 1, chloroplastic [Tetrabaena socialis]
MLSSLQRRGVAPAATRRAAPAPTRVVVRRAVAMPVRAVFKPPTVSDTKAKFFEGYSKPIASIYSTVLQELLVQQHFMRYSKNYTYNEIYALGFVSVYEQILESLPEAERAGIFVAYVQALGEDPEMYKRDAARIEQAASSLTSPDSLTPDASGNDVQKALATISAAAAAGTFSYNKFVAIGLFRLLELTGAKEPAALERLVKAAGIKPDAVNRDLMMYKGVLSKLSAAREMLKEFVEREKRKQGEREAAKAAKLAGADKPAEASVQV